MYGRYFNVLEMIKRGGLNPCSSVFRLVKIPIGLPPPWWAELRGRWKFAWNPWCSNSTQAPWQGQGHGLFTAVSSALRISGWHEVGVQQIWDNKYMNGREKTHNVQVLPFVAHLKSFSCKKPQCFFLMCVSSVPLSILYPAQNTKPMLNPSTSPEWDTC